jgi:hypothetical protein
LGAPFLNRNCRVDLAGAQVLSSDAGLKPLGRWPKAGGRDLSRFPGAGQKSAGLYFLKNLKSNWYAVTDQKKKTGFGLAWDKKAYPYLWFWQVYGGNAGYPWWGRNFNCSLEPHSSIPDNLSEAVALGTQMKFKPFETKRAWVTALAISGKSKIKKISRAGSAS